LGLAGGVYLALGGFLAYRWTTMAADSSDLSVLDPYAKALVGAAYLLFASVLVRSMRRRRTVRAFLVPVAFVAAAVLELVVLLAVYAVAFA
jgi:hypothetical protein